MEVHFCFQMRMFWGLFFFVSCGLLGVSAAVPCWLCTVLLLIIH